MVNKKEILIVSPELTIDEKSEEPVFKRDADRTSSSDQLPMPDQIESLFEQEWSTELPGFDLIPSAAPVSFEIPDRLEPWVVEPEMPEPVAFVERPQIASNRIDSPRGPAGAGPGSGRSAGAVFNAGCRL